jgi:response regulator RpfG family c-di-GMP phosphodiesterase
MTLVEDEPRLLDVLVRATRSWRYECQTADSAEQALRLLEHRLTPIVITDLHMPGEGGVWLVRQIRERWPDVAIIVITASQEIDAAIECLNAGASQYFLKPLRLNELHDALEVTLRACRLRREREHYQRKLERAVRRQTRRVRSTFLSAIHSLVRTLEARDRYTSGHSRRVRCYAESLAAVLGLDQRQQRQLKLAAQLHDIGKVGIPEAILNKPGNLSAEEYRLVQEHPVIGERILGPIIHSAPVLAAIRSHHERLDGRGYPDGLAGDDVPLLARVITVVDCFDALTSSRAYRSHLTLNQALEVLRAGSGTQFEPAFVQAFIDRIATQLSSSYPIVHG